MIFLFLSLFTIARAESLTPLLSGGLEFGGDTLVDATYSDGSKSDIPAGRGLLLQAGALIELGSGIELQGTLGMKWTSVKPARNGSLSWIRWPLEILVFHRWESFRLGAGPTYHFGNKLSGSGDAAALSMPFENALGFVAQGEYLFGGAADPGLGLRYTNIKYRHGSASTDGSSFGLVFTYFLHEGT